MSAGPAQPLLLSVDFEDWHQLVRRRVGDPGWAAPGPALGRQTRALLALLRELGVRATFFVLGMAARSHPELVAEIVAEGHEIGCHGDAHRPVRRQTRQEFAADIRAARATIEDLSGRRPLGYRAPAFSIGRDQPWAYEVLADEGFAYDSSQNDTPLLRQRARPELTGPHRLELPGGRGLWEFPLAVWRTPRGPVPLGGASYWALMPSGLVLAGLRRSGELPGLYLHPHEFDPRGLRAGVCGQAPVLRRAHGGLRAAQRNLARWRAPSVLRAIAQRHALIPYGAAHGELDADAPARP